MENKMKRIEIDANKPITEINSIIQSEIDDINTENGTITAYNEDLNNSTYCYNIAITYTTP